MTFALKYVKAAPALAMSYLSVVWSILYGYYIFGDVRPAHTRFYHLSLLVHFCASSLQFWIAAAPYICHIFFFHTHHSSV